MHVACTLSVPHSFSQSVSMRDYDINFQNSAKNLMEFLSKNYCHFDLRQPIIRFNINCWFDKSWNSILRFFSTNRVTDYKTYFVCDLLTATCNLTCNHFYKVKSSNYKFVKVRNYLSTLTLKDFLIFIVKLCLLV